MPNPDEIGALWISNKPDKNGHKYMTGNVNGQKVVVFRNKKDEGSKAPDFRILKSIPKGEREEDDGIPI